VNDNTQAAGSGALTTREFGAVVGKFLLDGHTVKEHSNLTSDNVEALYALAHGEYDSGQFQQAQRLFGLLCTLDHMQRRNWMGLGASCQMSEDYKGAVAAYAIAALFDLTDPTAGMHAADCYLAMGDREAAADGFRYVVQRAGERPEYASIKQRAAARLGMMSPGDDKGTT